MTLFGRRQPSTRSWRRRRLFDMRHLHIHLEFWGYIIIIIIMYTQHIYRTTTRMCVGRVLVILYIYMDIYVYDKKQMNNNGPVYWHFWENETTWRAKNKRTWCKEKANGGIFTTQGFFYAFYSETSFTLGPTSITRNDTWVLQKTVHRVARYIILSRCVTIQFIIVF